nr:ARID DNA-binding domain-containing protein [Tanacetum cinerariifolium]
MVNTNSFLENRWSRPSSSAYGLPNMWYQSKLGRPLRKRQQHDFIQRQLRREKEAQLGTCIRQITQDCKEMLRKKMEEIELYNSTFNQPQKHDEGTQRKGNTSETAKEINGGFMTTKPTNEYLKNYFESLNTGNEREKAVGMLSMEDDLIEIKGTTYLTKVNTFNEFVGFLKLLKHDEIISQEWDTFRKKFDRVVKWFYERYLEKPLPGPIPPKIIGVTIYLMDLYKLVESFEGYLSVYFEREFGKIGEILGLSIQDGKEVRKFYINFLDVFTSYYKNARVPKQEHNTVLAPNKEAASTKGKEKIEHFGIILEDTRKNAESYQIQPISQNIKRSQSMDKELQGMIKTSMNSNKEDTNSSSNDDFTIIA